MLVDRVAVIAVANYQRIDAVKFGNQHLQHAECVHGSQRVCRMRTEQHFTQRVPEIRPLGDMDGERRQRIGDAVFGRLRQCIAMRRHQREDAQDGGGIAELRAGKNVDAPLVENEVGAGDRRPAAAELAVEADRRRQMLHQQARRGGR